MSKGQKLRAQVNERLAAAAEEIFVLFERTIAEYEEELCRSKEENQKTQQLLDAVLHPKIELVRGNVQISPTSPGPGLKKEIPVNPQVKEESSQRFKLEELQLQVPVPESSVACVDTEQSSPLQQTEIREETLEEKISFEPFFHSETANNDWGPRRSYAQIEKEVEYRKHYNQVKIRDRGSTLFPQNQPASETSVHSRTMSGADGAERKKHQCPFCQKSCLRKENLDRHIRVHTGERPYSCTMCDKTFADLSTIRRHNKVVHSGEKTFSCSICNKNFAHKYTLEYHRRTHTGEKPYSCSSCEKTFADHSTFRRHIRTHTGEQPFSCAVCHKTFARKDNLRSHMSIHSF